MGKQVNNLIWYNNGKIELDENVTTEDFSVVRQEGNRLDAVISVGYRVSSYKATKFRQWSTSVLKKYNSQSCKIAIAGAGYLELSNDKVKR